MLLTLIWTLVVTLGLWLPIGDNLVVFYVFAPLFGFGSGSIISMAPVCLGQLCRADEYGQYYGTSYSVVAFAYVSHHVLRNSLIDSQYNGVYPNWRRVVTAHWSNGVRGFLWWCPCDRNCQFHHGEMGFTRVSLELDCQDIKGLLEVLTRGTRGDRIGGRMLRSCCGCGIEG